MMQFIVLGQIPGTHLQLTFIWFQLILAIVIASVATIGYYLYASKVRRHLLEQVEVLTLQNLDQA